MRYCVLPATNGNDKLKNHFNHCCLKFNRDFKAVEQAITQRFKYDSLYELSEKHVEKFVNSASDQVFRINQHGKISEIEVQQI